MIKWTIGTCQYPELVGFMIYHRNRLIQPFLKVGIHKEQNTKGAGIIGIVEANQLTPTHNIQDFHDCKLYNELRKRLGESLKVVCDEKEATATTAVAAPSAPQACQSNTCEAHADSDARKATPLPSQAAAADSARSRYAQGEPRF